MPMFGCMLAASGATAYSTVTSALGTSFGDLVTNTGTMIAAVLPVGITIFGMYALIGFGKKVFSKITGSGK